MAKRTRSCSLLPFKPGLPRDSLGQATVKIHCVSDEDVDNGIIAFKVKDKISEALREREDHFLQHIVEFGMSYCQTVFADYALFFDAFREELIAGI